MSDSHLSLQGSLLYSTSEYACTCWSDSASPKPMQRFSVSLSTPHTRWLPNAWCAAIDVMHISDDSTAITLTRLMVTLVPPPACYGLNPPTAVSLTDPSLSVTSIVKDLPESPSTAKIPIVRRTPSMVTVCFLRTPSSLVEPRLAET